jgi:hypothetical protein
MAMGLNLTQTAAQVIGWLAFFGTFCFILIMAAIRNRPPAEVDNSE